MRPSLSPSRWLPTERLLALDPAPRPDLSGEWRRRLLAFPKRSLSAGALSAEQDQRAGRLALRGQMLASGVITGLRVDFDRDEPSILRIAAGHGLAASGEDVSLARDLVVAAGALPVADTRNPGIPDAIDLTLAEFGPASQALVLVLRPIEVRTREATAPGDPCDDDPVSDAFADHQRIDGALPVWVRLPDPLAKLAADAGAPARLNRLAHAIFDLELAAPRDDEAVRTGMAPALPWEALGVPLALVGFDAEGKLQFVDRHAVVRRGGKARPRSALLPRGPGRLHYTGTPSLWQARIEQLAEHLLDLRDRVAPDAIAGAFAHAPPAGLLPLDLFDSLPAPERRQRFFPPHAFVEWAAIPLDQLDAELAASASLASFDLSCRFVVRLLLPVPPSVFEPRLLVAELPNAALAAQRDQLKVSHDAARADREARDAEVRGLRLALDGSGAAPPVEPLPQVTQELAAFVAQVQELAGLRVAKKLTEAQKTGGLRAARAALADLADRTDDTIDLGFLRVQTDIYRARQVVLGNQKGMQLAASPTLAAIVQGSTAFASEREVEKLFEGASKRRTPPAPDQPPPVEPPRTPVAVPPGFATELLRRPTTPAALREFLARQRAVEERAVATPRPAVAIKDEVRDEITATPEFAAPAVERTVSIVERLAKPPAEQAHEGARASKYTLLDGLRRLSDELDLDALTVSVPEGDAVALKTFGEIKDGLPGRAAAEAAADATPGGAKIELTDEARILSAGVRMLDESVHVLRQVTVRVANLRQLIAAADALLVRLQALLGEHAPRLAAAEKTLAEASHDLTVAEALVAEDAKDVETTNARRRNILTEHVRFVAFVRPRSLHALDDPPARDLEAPEELPVLACFREDTGPVLPEIRQAVDLVRRAPLRWFPHFQPLLDALDERATLAHLVRSTVALAPLTMVAPAKHSVQPEALPIARGLQAGISAMQAQLAERDEALQKLDVPQAEKLAWRELRGAALDVVSLADFAHVGHLRPDVLQRAGQAIDSMTRVATCLYRRFADVRPDIRLAWAQQLGVFDTAVGLRDLLALPRFAELPADDRATMQALVDWLFSQVSPLPRPRAMIDNLIRVCALLASHAPVRALLRGTIGRTAVSVGHVLKIHTDLAGARIGMNALVKVGAPGKERLIRAVVEDLSDEHISARVLATPDPIVELPERTEVLLGDPDQLADGVARVLARVNA